MLFARNGGFKLANSYITQPRDQISLFESYLLNIENKIKYQDKLTKRKN